MRLLSILAALALALSATPSLASFSGNKPEPSTPSSVPERETLTPRQQAERFYGDAYDEVAKAKQDLARNKQKNAQKKFKRALERGERAVELDSTYYEAWNLVGYSARNLGRYDESIAAYQRCLSIKPDYAPAREYLGEAYVELGQPDQAREQLVWLDRLDAREESASLKARLDAWLAAHPDAKAGTPAAAASDTTTKASAGEASH